MTTFDFTPLYRSSVGFDQLAVLLDNAMQQNQGSNGYPPYNIESKQENHYTITLAVAGFEQDELEIEVEKSVLAISGRKTPINEKEIQYLHQGIATRSFERKFQLADHIQVANADLRNGLLTVSLVKEVPEEDKPKQIKIATAKSSLEHKAA